MTPELCTCLEKLGDDPKCPIHATTTITRCCNTCGHAFKPVCIYDLTCPDCQKAHAERMAKITFTRQEYVDQLAAEEAEERDRQDEIRNARNVY